VRDAPGVLGGGVRLLDHLDGPLRLEKISAADGPLATHLRYRVGLRYQCGNGFFSLFHSSEEPSGDHTQMAWEVDDVRAGVVFEAYDLPGIKTVNGIVEVAGHYPSRDGIGERAAWFHDSEGNLLGIGQPIR
jgi:hypothetical protein